ncbi:HAD family phosphatase [Streptomyces sp. NPDC005813]|uniref:HAD family hydrolase n=1 Tax=Streptomyces sp. NPDC005813 TaxID=3155592 RepID=UPI0033E596D0
MTDTVLFDLFGVIARTQSPEDRERVLRAADLPAAHSADRFWDAYWSLRPDYDSGRTDGRQYWRQVAEALDTRFDARRTDALVAADIAGWDGVDPDMIGLVGELSTAGRDIALLSNIPAELAAHYERHHGWLGHFRLRAFSCRIGHAKPDPAAFRWCVDALGTEPRNILFVDDRPENVRAAEELGIQGHLFAGAAPLRTLLTSNVRGGGEV